MNADGTMVHHDHFILVFELDTGSKMELGVNHKVYHNTPENTWGMLTFQGTWFHRFEPAGV